MDTAATAAVWANPDLQPGAQGATANLTVHFLNAGRQGDTVATARVIRRGRSLCSVEANAHDPHQRHIASALVSYRLQNVPSSNKSESVSLAGDVNHST